MGGHQIGVVIGSILHFLFLICTIICLFIIARKQTFLDTYDNIILPSNGLKLWPEVDTPPILPPYVKRAPGRPKKFRMKNNDEPKSTSRKVKRNHETVT